MNVTTLILGGAVVLLGVSYLKKKQESVKSPLSVSAVLNYYITPYNPGIVQYGELLFNRVLDGLLTISDIRGSFASEQYTQSGKTVSASEMTSCYVKISPDVSVDAQYSMFPGNNQTRVPFSVQITKYLPTGNPFVVTDDFSAKPVSVLIDVSYKVNGEEYMETIEVPFTSVKH